MTLSLYQASWSKAKCRFDLFIRLIYDTDPCKKKNSCQDDFDRNCLQNHVNAALIMLNNGSHFQNPIVYKSLNYESLNRIF